MFEVDRVVSFEQARRESRIAEIGIASIQAICHDETVVVLTQHAD